MNVMNECSLHYRNLDFNFSPLCDVKVEYRGEARKRKIERLWERLQSMALDDDVLFRMTLHKNVELIDLILSLFVPRYEKGSIKEVISNYEIPGAVTKTSKLDVYASSDKMVVNIDMQKSSDPSISERIWQYSANIINSFILKGGDYSLLSMVHIVFLHYDAYGDGLPYYALTMKDQNGVERDGSVMFIYVNMTYAEDDCYGMLNHDLMCAEPSKMYYNEIRKSVENVKKRGGLNMASNILDELIEEEVAIAKAEMRQQFLAEGRAEGIAKGIAKGRAEGKIEGRRDFLKILLRESSASDISEKFGIPLEKVNSVANS